MVEPTEEEKPQIRIFGTFKKVFWVVNVFEGFERGAYYGMMAILGIHIVQNLLVDDAGVTLDYAETLWGALYSMMIIMMYFLPLVSGALAEKIGYKFMLLISFGFMLGGYFTLGMVRPQQTGFLFVSLFLVAVGAGAFKPIISATVAHVTRPEERNLAYSIYYWMINFGATLTPFIIGFMFVDVGMYYYVFILSGVMVIFNVIILLILFRNPVEPQKDLSVLNAFKRLIPALQDRKFITLLLIYSGFWFMFVYNHTFLPVSMVQFGKMPDWFPYPWLSVFNPLTIIILGPFLAKFVAPYKSLNLLMTGIIIFCIGLIINGFSRTPTFFVLGIIIFSIGEFIAHPGFIAYVSKIAPKDKVAIYMACIFLSTGLGQLFGGITHGVWYSTFAKAMLMPQVYVALVAAVGLFTLFMLMVYNRWIIRISPNIDKAVKEDVGIFTKRSTMMITAICIPLLIGGSFLTGTMAMVDQDGPDGGPTPWDEWDTRTQTLDQFDDTASENSDQDVSVMVYNTNVRSVTFTLRWTDEAAAGPRFTNEPDSFSLTVTPPNGSVVSSTASTTGTVSVTVTFDLEGSSAPYYNGTGEYVITVECGVCGDQVPFVNIGGLRVQADNGNAWDLFGATEFYLEPQEG
jgi:POT family proton-dependent oligopeptide transporter